MSAKWNLIIDVARCDNCRNCFLATKDEHIGNDFPGYSAPQPARGHRWIDIRAKERGAWPIIEANFMPVMCNHCDRPPCMQVATGGAVRKRDDGIVIIDPDKAKGQKDIVDACPYGAVYWNDELQIPQAWTFDAHLLDQGWQKTRAEQVCPLDVFRSLKLSDDEMQSLAQTEGLRVLRPEIGSRPRVYYRNLHLMDTCFVGGTVVFSSNGKEECAEDCAVMLFRGGEEIGRAATDVFGEFRIDRLEPHSGPYVLEVRSAASGRVSTEFSLGEDSLYLGVLRLGAAA